MHVIDGIFFTRRLTGIQRVAYNIVRELDEIASPGELQILVPEYCTERIDYKNIEVVRYGKRKGYLWEQLDLSSYLRKKRAKGLFLENAVPFFYRKGIVTLHDISLKVNPGFYTGSARKTVTMLIWRAIYRSIVNSDMKIVTVSEFSRSEILRVYGIDEKRITVIGGGWQHMNDISEDEGIIKRLCLREESYYFCMATAAPNKNLNWILKAAEKYSDETFVIAGQGTADLAKRNITSNVIPAGYVSDGEAKSLMRHCKAFLFPTFYEGFGLPPMEALSAGAKAVILSDTLCMREVYGDAAGYIDPYDYENIRLPIKILTKEELDELLSRYSWKKSAKKYLECLRDDEG